MTLCPACDLPLKDCRCWPESDDKPDEMGIARDWLVEQDERLDDQRRGQANDINRRVE